MSKLPFVTAMIVVRNEEKYIEKCLKSLLEQEYENYEILVVDGESTDKTLEKIDSIIKKYNKISLKVLKNEKRILASGWNIGIKNARGEYVVRIDAHSYVEKDFLLKNVETLLEVEKYGVVCVGGTLTTSSLTNKGKVIATILSSPFGVGNSRFRYSNKREYVDTVAFGLYKKEIFKKVGLFDENLKRNQDNDMHRRIREVGGKFYLNPDIKSTYYCRDSIFGMLKQAYLNGKWNIITFYKSKDSLAIRHLIPLCFVLGIIFCLGAGYYYSIFWKILLGVLTIHFVLGLYSGINKKVRGTSMLILPICYLMLHVSYGIGSLFAIIKLPYYVINYKNKERK